jgi:hypothetical protein
MNRDSIVVRVSCRDVMRAAGLPAPQPRKPMCCPLPGHDDRSPSFKFVGENETGFVCFGCGQKGGVLALCVALGLAADNAAAAQWLEGRT